MPINNISSVISINDAAAMLGSDPETVRQRLKAHAEAMPPGVKIGRRVFFYREAWARYCEVAPLKRKVTPRLPPKALESGDWLDADRAAAKLGLTRRALLGRVFRGEMDDIDRAVIFNRSYFRAADVSARKIPPFFSPAGGRV